MARNEVKGVYVLIYKENTLSKARKYEVPIVVDSDSHFALNIAKVDDALRMLSEIEFPEKLIINTDFDKLVESVKDIRGRDIKGTCLLNK